MANSWRMGNDSCQKKVLSRLLPDYKLYLQLSYYLYLFIIIIIIFYYYLAHAYDLLKYFAASNNVLN